MFKKLAIVLAILFTVSLATAQVPPGPGSVGLAWDAVTQDVSGNPVVPTGYKIYYGTVPRGAEVPPDGYAVTLDVGDVLSFTVTNLPDCQDLFFATTAYLMIGASEFESGDYSNEVGGWSQPRISSTVPTTIPQGYVGDVEFVGMNYQPGAVANFPGSTINVTGTAANSCGSVVVTVDVPGDEPVGGVDVRIVNADGVSSGPITGLLTVTATDSPAAPTGLRRTENN